MTTSVEAMLADLDNLPARQGTALRLLQLLQSADEAPISEIASATAADAVLCGRVMRLANSAAYGRVARVTSVRDGLMVIGFETVRALALTAVYGLTGSGAVPSWFWERSLAVAAAGRLVATSLRMPAGEVLTAAVFMDLGEVLLYRAHPDTFTALREDDPEAAAALAREQAAFGTDHALLGAAALAHWSLPEPIVTAVRSHHDEAAATPLNRALRAAQLVAAESVAAEPDAEALARTLDEAGEPQLAASSGLLLLSLTAQVGALREAFR